jgi:hypothetical protein
VARRASSLVGEIPKGLSAHVSQTKLGEAITQIVAATRFTRGTVIPIANRSDIVERSANRIAINR